MTGSHGLPSRVRYWSFTPMDRPDGERLLPPLKSEGSGGRKGPTRINLEYFRGLDRIRRRWLRRSERRPDKEATKQNEIRGTTEKS